ncbi:dehydrogenase [Oceaniferula spumae]|uniref:Dehydrogenase n=1 Tax=Oceaniferula spumae TaxID=2979115 RepID=A0AAT9FM12_9BACT
MNHDSENNTRRSFLKKASAVAAVTPILGVPSIVNAQNLGSKTIKVGLIGCGGRGTGAATQALSADKNVQLWAVGDAFDDKIQGSLKQLKRFGKNGEVPKERQFTGLDAFQKVIDSGVDVVLLASPPGFRPQHLRAAVEAKKHTFAEKPMAVDMAGVKSVLESTELAKKNNVAIQHGFCWRYAPSTRAAYGKILNGDFGRVTSIYGTYMGSVYKPIPKSAVKPKGMGDVEWQVRWWTNYEWLSGAPILEQSIHSVDKIAWGMGDVAPIAAVGTGGRIQRDDPSNVYDHYNVAYEYPNGVMCHLGARQFSRSHGEVIDRIFCENGSVIGPNQPRAIDGEGKTTWRYKPEPGSVQNMYQVCHNEFFADLRAGKINNTGEYMANSTALAILGREAAHTGKRITWDQLFKNDEDMAPDSLKFEDSFAIAPVPVPGKKA